MRLTEESTEDSTECVEYNNYSSKIPLLTGLSCLVLRRLVLPLTLQTEKLTSEFFNELDSYNFQNFGFTFQIFSMHNFILYKYSSIMGKSTV